MNINNMKHRITMIAVMAMASLSFAAVAQDKQGLPDPEGHITYSLPMTSIDLEVEAVQEKYYSGPYAKFAEKYLGIKARQKDETSYQITEIKMSTFVEANPDKRYSLNVHTGKMDETLLTLSSAGLLSFSEGKFTDDSPWRYLRKTKGDFSDKGISSNLTSASTTLYKNSKKSSKKESVQQNMVVEKSLEKKASEAAELIFKLRQYRLKIVTGDTDANYSGEAMAAALAELTRLEEEYMTLFLGYSETQTQRMNFEIIPEGGRSSQMYVAFRLSDTDGLVSADNLSGKPIIMEITAPPFKEIEVPELDPKQAKKLAQEREKEEKKGIKRMDIHYCMPAMCTVKIMDGMNVLLNDRIPIYQLGQESTYPVTVTFKVEPKKSRLRNTYNTNNNEE